MYKGIILAGGVGTRLYPLTKSISKQILPIYNKPMIYYPLSTLISLGIQDILIISDPKNINCYRNLLNNSGDFGIKISFKVQKNPNGLAEALIIGQRFLNGDKCVLILGDNIFYSPTMNTKMLFNNKTNFKNKFQSKIFLYKVNDPNRYGVAKVDESTKKITKIIEKPKKFVSNYAVTGLYIYDEMAPIYAKKLKPSKRNELEITDLNNKYISLGKMSYEILPETSVWMDTGTYSSLIEASQFVQSIENRQNTLIGSPEYTSFKNKIITKKKLNSVIYKNKNNMYYKILQEKLKFDENKDKRKKNK